MKGKGSVRRRLVSESSDEELLSVRKSARRKAAVTYDDSINSDWERDASLMVCLSAFLEGGSLLTSLGGLTGQIVRDSSYKQLP